jgi:hypothetical protein
MSPYSIRAVLALGVFFSLVACADDRGVLRNPFDGRPVLDEEQEAGSGNGD